MDIQHYYTVRTHFNTRRVTQIFDASNNANPRSHSISDMGTLKSGPRNALHESLFERTTMVPELKPCTL